jgi:hypothetical protein
MSETTDDQQDKKGTQEVNTDNVAEELETDQKAESLNAPEAAPANLSQDTAKEDGSSPDDPEMERVALDSVHDGNGSVSSSESEESVKSGDEASENFKFIREDLGALKAQVERLANPKSEELDRAKRLILLLSGVTGIVMVASITFFIVMSVSISQKVSELDRVLMAVAKRGVQLGDGLIKISEMDNKLVRVIEQNEPIPFSLERIENQISNQGRALIDKEEENFISLRSRFEPLIQKQNDLEFGIQNKFQELEVHVSRTFDLKSLEDENLEVSKKLDSLDNEVAEIKGKVNDLYAIKRAEMEKVFIELKNGDE